MANGKPIEADVNERKVAVIGCGFVGAASAFSLMESGMFSEMVLIDADRGRAEGEALDISHGIPFAQPMRIYAGDYADIEDAAVTVITAGAAQMPGETRLDLVHKNVAIFKSILANFQKINYRGILLIVSNPVDILTYMTMKLSGLPEHRVIGSGTVLDTARLKYTLGQQLGVDARGVHAFIIGEHGDSELAAWSSANISGVPIDTFCKMRGKFRNEDLDQLEEKVKNAAYEIIAKKQATYFGIAMSVRRICEAIIRDEHSVLPVSGMMHGEYGIEDVSLSVPALVSAYGVEHKVPVPLSKEEEAELRASAAALREVINSLDF